MGSTKKSDPISFGPEMLRKHFLINPKYRPLNHGGYGTFPRAVQTAQRAFQDEQESRVDVWFQRTRTEHINVARKAIANLVHAPVDECVFVTNASTGIDTVLRNLNFKTGDVVICFATVYYTVSRALLELMESTSLKTRMVEYTFPISHEEIVQRFLAVVWKAKGDGLNVRAAVFDTIVSVPGVRFPFEKLIKACKAEGVLSVVDGAHGVGQIPLNLGALDPDFFITNCHKWLYTPRGCALLYAPKRNQPLIRTTFPTSPGYSSLSDKGAQRSGSTTRFENLFEFVGTADDTAFMCVPAALKFREEICRGEDTIYAYLQRIAREGGDRVAEILGTEVLQEPKLGEPQESEIRRCALVNIRLPLGFKDDVANPDVPDPATSPYDLLSVKDAATVDLWMKTTLMEEFDTYAKFFPHAGWMWVRLSGQIYLDIADFEWFAHVLVGVCDRAGNGEWLKS